MATEYRPTATTEETPKETSHPLIDPLLHANSILTEIGKETKLTPETSTKIKDLIVKAIDERVGEMDDIRVGRVLGSALATL